MASAFNGAAMYTDQQYGLEPFLFDNLGEVVAVVKMQKGTEKGKWTIYSVLSRNIRVSYQPLPSLLFPVNLVTQNRLIFRPSAVQQCIPYDWDVNYVWWYCNKYTADTVLTVLRPPSTNLWIILKRRSTLSTWTPGERLWFWMNPRTAALSHDSRCLFIGLGGAINIWLRLNQAPGALMGAYLLLYPSVAPPTTYWKRAS